MLSFAPDEVQPSAVADELMNGGGAVHIAGLFTDEEVAEARRIIMQHSEADAAKVTHFQGAAEAEGTITLQRRVWNLLA
ncbi:MAG: phytanoyl-CoA dioxygenase, partial [Pseudomonadota bacterium]